MLNNVICKLIYGLNNVKQDHTHKNFEKVHIKFYINATHNTIVVNYLQVVDLQTRRVNI